MFRELEDVGEMEESMRNAAKQTMKGTGEYEEVLKMVGLSLECGFASYSRRSVTKGQEIFEKRKLVSQLADEIWPGGP